METLLKGSGKTVTIDNEGTFTIIGESINPTRRIHDAGANKPHGSARSVC